MNRPLRSQYLGRRYAIDWKPAGTVVLQVEGEPAADAVHCYGLTDNDRGWIQIEDNLRPSKEREVLIHELLHQMLAANRPSWLDTDMEEDVCAFLGVALGAHLDANPLLWKYLLTLGKAERAD